MIKSYAFVIILSFVSSQFAQSFEDSLKIKIMEHSSIDEQVDYLNSLADQLRVKSKLEEAIITSKKAIELVGQNNLDEKLSKTYSFLGLSYRDQAKYLEAQKCFQKAVSVAIRLEQKIQVAYGYNNLATIDRVLSNYSSAIENIYKSLSIFKEIGDKKGESHCHINLGILFRYQKKYDKSLEHLNKAAEIREQMQNLRGLGQAEYLIAETYFESGKYETALKYYTKAEKTYADANFSSDFTKNTLYMAFAGTYYALNQFHKSLEYRLKTLKFIKKSGDKNNLARVYLAIGKIYIKLKKYSLAEKNLKEAYKYAEEVSLKSRVLEITQTKADLYSKWNKPRLAYKFLEEYSELKDSIYSSESKEQIAKLEAEFKTREKEKENELLSAKLEIESQKSFYYLITALFSLGFIFLLFILYKNTRKRNQLLQEMIDTKDLFFSIISHDIKNPFGVIMNSSEFLLNEKDTLEENDKAELIENINTASKRVFNLLENLLKWAQSQRGILNLKHSELKIKEIVDKVILLISDSANAKNNVIINNIPQSLTVLADQNTISLVIRNLLTNAIKFCENGKIEINSKLIDDMAYIEVSDTGIGIESERINNIFSVKKANTTIGTSGEKGSGLGLLLCKDFVEKNGGTISVSSEKGKGSKFTFNLKVLR